MQHLFKELGYFLILPLLFLTIAGALAQGLTVQGKVTDENGVALPGVTVLLKGSTTGTATDADGRYSLTVPSANGTLTFSFISFKTQEVLINNRTTIDIQLGADAKALEEVVVVGYGTQKRSDITGSVASVPKDRLSNLPVTNLTQAIQGTTAGLNISQSSSVPGSPGTMQMNRLNRICFSIYKVTSCIRDSTLISHGNYGDR